MWSSSLRQEEHLYFVSLPSLEGFFFPQRSTSQSLEMTPNKKPKLNAELLPPCTRVLSQTCITRCCCNSSSAWSQRSSCAFRSARSPPPPPHPRPSDNREDSSVWLEALVWLLLSVTGCTAARLTVIWVTDLQEPLKRWTHYRCHAGSVSLISLSSEKQSKLAHSSQPLRSTLWERLPSHRLLAGMWGWWGGGGVGVRLSNVDFSLPEMKWTRGFVFSQANENSAVFMVGWWEQNWGREGNQQWENK